MLLPKPYLCLCLRHSGVVVLLLRIWPLFLKCLARLLLSQFESYFVLKKWHMDKGTGILSKDLGLVPSVLLAPHNHN